MQNEVPADFSVSSLPPLPERIQFGMVMLICFFLGMGIFNLFCENWLGAGIDFALVSVAFVFAYLRYRKLSVLYSDYRVLKVMEKIINTPVMKEEANSIIFTFVCPSPAIMEEIARFHKQQEEKGKE